MDDRYSYRNLILWQHAQEIAYEVLQIVKSFPRTWAAEIIARQIIRSATSIAANIAEGHGRFTLGAHRNHLLIARGSATETDSWLDLLRREGLIHPEKEEVLHGQCKQLVAMLTSKINKLDNQRDPAGGDIRESSESYAVFPSTSSIFPFEPDDYLTDT